MQHREKDAERVTEANRRIAPAEREAGGDLLPDSDDDVTEANRRLSRPPDTREDATRRDSVTLLPPD